jgi:integrase
MSHTFTDEDLLRDPQLKKFLSSRKKKGKLKEATKSGYILALKSFCNFTSKSPTEIHDLHKKELRNRVPEMDQWLATALDDYVEELSVTHTHDTIRLYISKIRRFLKHFRLTPPGVEIDKEQVHEDPKHALKAEDIQKAIRNSPTTYQTLFTTQAQTGLSVGDALLLDIEDFILAIKYSDQSPQYWPKEGEVYFTSINLEEAIKKAKINDNIIGCFDLKRKKTSNKFYTFAGPECLRSIANLLDSRNHNLEQNDPIFLKDGARLEKNREDLRKDFRLTTNAVNAFCQRMHHGKALFPQIIVDDEKRNYFRTHKIRAWFANQVKYEAKLSWEDTKFLMGHKTGDVLERYVHVNNYLNLKNNYRKALPSLSVTGKVVVKNNLEAIERISVENVEIRKENKELKEMFIRMEEDIMNLTPERLVELQEKRRARQ